ncbi:50S ribosomal protein L23 [Candidatus Kaiserbacteria bacterium]|nr:50S ribosomal protein L23 [Candidatus Kaiserbacteria bacterium]
MALFSRNKTQKETKETTASSKAPAKAAVATDRNLSSVIIKPRISEKAVTLSGGNVYTFIVAKEATKYDVRDAIKAIYSVTPVKVNIVNKRPRKELSRMRGRVSSQKGYKKAYVYLKKGDSISLV